MLDDGPTPENKESVESLRLLDHILCAQFAVAWAGESGEEGRLGWWKTDLTSEFGGVCFRWSVVSLHDGVETVHVIQ